MIAPLAVEAVRRIVIFAVERTVMGQSALQRQVAREQHAGPVLADLRSWMAEQRSSLSRSSDVAKAIDYMLKDPRSPPSLRMDASAWLPSTRRSPVKHSTTPRVHG
ncbi:transposase [Novosphingobium sp. 9U]|uniref:IS66 family transposase n=1 Tax=Novosphingobium sp. 9U TaxID=2653158 RepID=UPI001359DAA1|nr:transposase [Novosphingobium sp. 9U]